MNVVNPGEIVAKFKTDDGRAIKCCVLDIMFWNMDTTDSKSITHPLGSKYLQIIDMSAVILNDAHTSIWTINKGQNSLDPALLGGNCADINDTQVTVYRTAGGYFDSANFNDGAILRGYIIIWYLD